MGVVFTLLFQYIHNIIDQPRLISKTVIVKDDEFNGDEARALFIASENLRNGIEERQVEGLGTKSILHAGYRNFRESWARDFGFASYGLLTLYEFDTVRDTLEAFFHYQTPTGQLPVKLKSIHVVSRFLHSVLKREQPITGTLKPKYITGHHTPSFDGQALLVIAAHAYISATGDTKFGLKLWDKLEQTIAWLQQFTAPGSHLLVQQPFADWADSIARKGTVLYTNVVYWKALNSMSELAAMLDKNDSGLHYQQLALSVKENIQQTLWRPDLGYFATSDIMDNLSSAGNLLAICWGLANLSQSRSILEAISARHMADPVPTQVVSPLFPWHQIALENLLSRLGSYHTNSAWLWIGAWHVIAYTMVGDSPHAKELLGRISSLIVRDQQVHEVYRINGRPLSTFLYTSEAPLSWNAGMVVYAIDRLEGHSTNQL